MPELSISATSFFGALPRAIIGGFAGTVVFTLMMKFLAPEMIGHPMDIAVVLGTFTGLGTPAGDMVAPRQHAFPNCLTKAHRPIERISTSDFTHCADMSWTSVNRHE